jgi:drug/metabolite transporter (DMT)-like permease
MAEGVVLALGAMVFYGLADLVYKRAAAAGVQAHHFLMVQAFCFAPGIILYGLITGTLAPGKGMLWGMGAGLLMFIALYNFARSLARGAVSINAPVFRLSFALTAALAVLLLGEPLTAWKLAGLAAALAAVWLLLAGGESGQPPERRVSRSSLVQVLVATAAMAVVNLFYKLGTLAGGSPATVLAGQASVFIVLATGFAWTTDRGIRPSRTSWSHAPVAAVLLLFATVMLLAGLTRGEASVLVPVAQMSFVVTAALGLILLREPFTLRKAAGLLFALAALACLARG